MILVTGANGFAGSALCEALTRHGFRVRGAVRDAGVIRSLDTATTEVVGVGDIGPATDWQDACAGVDCVIHLAARTHVLRETAADSLAEYRRVNLEGTRRLAQTAARSGVRRFIFVSSIKVNGERTTVRAFTERDPPLPEDAYGISKWEAEQAVWQVTAGTGTEAVVLRLPLVYGPGVKGNFLRLAGMAARGLPLPLASVRNRRSLVFLGNLVDAVIACMEAPAAPGKTYLVSDGEDVSTPELIRALAAALGAPARIFPFPISLLRFGAAALGKRGAMEKLTGSLQVDSSLISNELGWRPRFSLTQGLHETARWYDGRARAPLPAE